MQHFLLRDWLAKAKGNPCLPVSGDGVESRKNWGGKIILLADMGLGCSDHWPLSQKYGPKWATSELREKNKIK